MLKLANRAGCDSIVTFEPENLFYMTGFWGEALGILKDNRTTIITPELEKDRAMSESHDCDIITADRGLGLDSLISHIKNSKVCTDCRDYYTILSLKKSVKKIKPTSEPFYNTRAIKDDTEIRILRRASKIIDDLFELCTKSIKIGQKESELQAILMSYAINHDMFDTGYKSTLNPLIIAGGPNGALPHAQVTNRKFKNRDLVVVDLTLRYKGYVSDATRTFAIGGITPQARDVYEIVKESQRLGLQAVKPDADCSYVDSTCRKFIEEQNYSKYFVHSTGHGIGLEVHEFPTISSKSKTQLKQNMAITVEPGIYIPGKFGVRIEDSLIVKNKPSVMHKFTKDLITI